jgi:putative hydrolase of the HAD superfamily
MSCDPALLPSALMPRAAVIFDLDDTLIVEEAFAMASLRQALAELPGVDPVAAEEVALESIRSVWRNGADHRVCLELGLASWEGLWSDFTGNHAVLNGLHAWAPTYRVEAWVAVATAFGVDNPALARAAANRFEAAQRAGHPVIDGMAPALAAVSARYPVGLLTNGPSDIQRLKLDQAGLSDAFGGVVISGELGVGKPSPEVFFAALGPLGARPEDSVMVGDSWERDIVGSLDAGMRAVWIADGRTAPESDPRVTVVDSVRELDDLLD